MRRSTPPLFDFNPCRKIKGWLSSTSQLERQLTRESLPLLPVTKMTTGQPGRESGYRPSGTRQRGNVAEHVTSALVTPTWIAPCLPTLVQKPPLGPDRLHEAKFDGYRAISVIEHGKARIFTQRDHQLVGTDPGIPRRSRA
jgi:hypothetical protein